VAATARRGNHHRRALNLVSNFGVFGVPTPGDTRAAIEGGVDEIEALEIVGSINRVTGIPALVTAFVMLITGVGMIALQPWAVTAGLIALGADIVLKIINIAAEIIIGTPLLAMTLAFALGIIQMFLFYLLKKRR
jgi:hypothetical protein